MQLGEWTGRLGDEQLRGILVALSDAFAEVARALRQDGSPGDDTVSTSSPTSHNVFGDEQLAVDVLADRLVRDRLLRQPGVSLVTSEEDTAETRSAHGGEYAVAYDPLDGSSHTEYGRQYPMATSAHIRPQCPHRLHRQSVRPGKLAHDRHAAQLRRAGAALDGGAADAAVHRRDGAGRVPVAGTPRRHFLQSEPGGGRQTAPGVRGAAAGVSGGIGGRHQLRWARRCGTAAVAAHCGRVRAHASGAGFTRRSGSV
eukprot:ctg_2287.g613